MNKKNLWVAVLSSIVFLVFDDQIQKIPRNTLGILSLLCFAGSILSSFFIYELQLKSRLIVSASFVLYVFFYAACGFVCRYYISDKFLAHNNLAIKIAFFISGIIYTGIGYPLFMNFLFKKLKSKY